MKIFGGKKTQHQHKKTPYLELCHNLCINMQSCYVKESVASIHVILGLATLLMVVNSVEPLNNSPLLITATFLIPKITDLLYNATSLQQPLRKMHKISCCGEG